MTEIENDLRSWMQERATRVHASPEILATDYRPRARSWRPRLAIGGALAALAGTATAVLSLAGGASTAFAGWSAQPTAASPAQLAAANAYCSANIPNPGLQQQLVDSRGPFTIIVYAGPAGSTQTYNFCTVGPTTFRNASGWTSSPPVTPADEQLF